MSEQRSGAQEGGEKRQRPGAAGIAGLLGSLLGIGGGGDSEPAQQNNIITGLDIVKVIEVILSDYEQRAEESENPLETAEEVLQTVREASRRLVDVYVKDGLSRIVPPIAARTMITTRTTEAITLLVKMVEREWRAVRDAMDGGAPPQELRKRLGRAVLASQLSYLVAETLMEKLVNLAITNAPAPLRPPLVNVALGFDIIDAKLYRR